MNMRKDIYFVRHAESRTNVTGIREGDESPLTERGTLEARAVARRLTQMHIDTICASDVKRAKDTGEIIRAVLGHEVVHATNLLHKVRDVDVALGTRFDQNALMGNWDGTVQRVDQALEYVRALPGERIVAVSHGFFMKVILARIELGAHMTERTFVERYLPLKGTNAGIMHVAYTEHDSNEGRGWELVSWDDHTHLTHGA